MGLPREHVKTRRYDASRRQARARERNAEVLRVAEQLFLRDGYAATTVAAVAAEAGVSAETIYKSFGGKAGLIRALQRRALAGVGPVPAEARSDIMSAAESNPDRILRNWAAFTEEISPRGAPIMLLVRAAAATDPTMATALAQMNRERLDRMVHNARRLLATGGLRAGLSVEQVRDVLYTVTVPELYETLVLDRGWTVAAYGEFVYRTMRAQLLP